MAALKTLVFLIALTQIRANSRDLIIQFPIAGLFNNEVSNQTRIAFEHKAVTTASAKSSSYTGRIFYPTVDDSFSSSLEVCVNTSDNKGIVALIDARPTKGYCDTICTLCNKLNIFHLTTGWEPMADMYKNEFSFSYYPPPILVSKAFAKLLAELGWDKFTIFYEDDSSLLRLQELIGTWPETKDPITFRQLKAGGDNLGIFKEILLVERLSHHIFDCDVKHITSYMNQILLVVNSIQYQNFVFTNLDTHTVDFKEVPGFTANVSTLYVTKPGLTLWELGLNSSTSNGGIKLETVLALDALKHFEKAHNTMLLNDNTIIDNSYVPPLCYQNDGNEYIPWSLGNTLRETMQTTIYEQGYTGNIEFDEEGQRKRMVLYYSKLDFNGEFQHAGIYDSERDLLETEDLSPDQIPHREGGTHITVISRNALPYFNVKQNGTESYEGYAVDLAYAIFNYTNKVKGYNFEVSFRPVGDGNYGNPIEGTRKWDGVIGELMEHKADLGICDLSITAERNTAVDFSTPFMTTGISMLFKERDPEDPDMFSFINPLSLDVWLYLATTYIVVSYILLICARMSQDDWVNPHPCNQNPESLQNIWSLYNCMWLTMGSIMTQGCDILPRGLGSRWVAGIWYFFAMIVTASYTANMSTFLSNSRRTTDIKDARELAEQTTITYGAVVNGSTYKFFKYSNDTVYQKLWQTMSAAQPTVFTKDNDEGTERVLKSKGNYAFFMESTAIKYYIARNPELRMVGSPLDSKAYGIAMPKNFQYKWLIDTALLTLQEEGTLNDLRVKWWKTLNQPSEEAKRKVVEEEDDSGSLQMKNTSGIFLVLGVGGVLGLIVAIIDFMMHARKISVKEKVTFKEALLSEWHASLNPKALSKPAAPPRSAPPSTRSSSTSRQERSHSRAVSVLRAATSFINFDEIY